MSNIRHSHDPSARPHSPPERTRAPLLGILAGVLLSAGLAFWTVQRIGEAKTVQSEVEAKRNAEAERAAALARQPAQVTVVQGTPERWQPRVEMDGTLQAEHEASLGFKVGGRLSRVAVKVGDRVRAGALLGQLDAAEAAAQARAAEAQVRAAEAALAIAEDGETRTLPLVQNGSLSQASGVQVTRQKDLALAQLDSARAQRALAVAGVGNHTLTAPFGGTITTAPTGIGTVVAPGQPLFSLVDTSKLKLSTTVSENDANLLAPGAAIHVASERGQITGRVTAVLATLDPSTRRVPVVAEFENAGKNGDARLRAGAFVRAWVETNEPIDVLRLPHGVLRPGSRDEIFVVQPGTSKLEARRLVFSVAPDGALLVRGGVNPGDRVVLAPIPEAHAGEVVRAEELGAQAAHGEAKEAAGGAAANVATTTAPVSAVAEGTP